jgi:hypothetical protein
MGPDAFFAMQKRISSSLMDKSKSYLEKRSDARIEQLIANTSHPSNGRG